MTEKTLTTENIKPALDALRGELAPWPVVAKKQDRLNTAQLNAANSGITSSLVAQIIANTAAIRALESAITGTGLRALVVATLPAVGTTGILYIVPVTTYDPDTDADVVNYSNEYIWIPVEGGTASEGHYEQVGQTGIVINNGQLTITVNGTSVGTFTANQSGDTTAAITVPTNADYVDLSTNQTVAGDKTWTGEQSFTLPIVGSITGTASKAIADEDGTSIKTGYGKLAGSQTWSGLNVFSNTIEFKNGRIYRDATTLTKGTLPSAITYYGITNNFALNSSSASNRINQQRCWVETDGKNVMEWNLTAWNTTNLATLRLSISADGTNKNFVVDANLYCTTGAYTLGTSTNQWSSVYAQSYYYNGTAWGLDKDNTWAGNNRFVKNASLSSVSTLSDNTVAFSANSNTIFFNTRGSTNYPSYGTFLNASYSTGTSLDRYGQLTLVRSTDKKGDTNDGYIPDTSFRLMRINPHYLSVDFVEAIRIRNDSANSYNYVAPITTGVTDLGTSTNKWKTLNGINPGALSLPGLSNAVSLDTTEWNVTGSSNGYTPTMNGWLCISIKDTATSSIYIYKSSGYSASAYGNGSQGQAGRLAIMLPVIANQTYNIIIKADALSEIYYAKFLPCLGNV